MPTDDLHKLPATLPWGVPAYLLLDGISVEALPQRLYEWSDSPDFDVLYLETPWAELRDVSPCLVHLSGPGDPALAAFLQNSQEEWGYLLFSRASPTEVLSQLRWLLSVRHPLGEQMLLRLADPSVMHVLFRQAAQDNEAALFGPIEQVVAADRMQNRWHQHLRPASTDAARRDQPYFLSDAQLERLGDVAFRGGLIRLEEHMRSYFPGYQPTLAQPQRWQHLRALAEQAYALGFHSEHDITLYANIFGLLGPGAMDDHSDIAALVRQSSSLTPTQRIEQAADMAYARAQSAERICE